MAPQIRFETVMVGFGRNMGGSQGLKIEGVVFRVQGLGVRVFPTHLRAKFQRSEHKSVL